MSDLKGLVLAIELATRQRDQAVATLLKARQTCHAVQDQMGQLESYSRETESHWALGSRTSANPEAVWHYDHFMERLQQAVELQQDVVHEHLQALEADRQQVMAAEVRMAALKRLLHKRQTTRLRVQARQETKQLDELAAMQFRRLHANSETMGTP